MSSDPMQHPTPEQLAAFDAGRLPIEVGEELAQHVAECAECCRLLETLPEDPLAAVVRAFAPAADPGKLRSANGSDGALPRELMGHPRYRALEVLGRGGMGVVYKALQMQTDRVVALKVMSRELQARPDFVARFRREVRALARLSHPNIVLAHDADEADDLHFLVMEYVDGISLDQLVRRRGPLPVREACEYVRQAALGLQHAHEKGLVHRDIKPGNLLLTHVGGAALVKVVDFGLARLAEAAVEATTPVAAPPLLGSLDYMAPEQARDPARVDIRADVYGLGCTLYHLLTGQPPFPDALPLPKLLSHQDRAPRPVTELRPDVDARLAALLKRMLAKDPRQRPSTPAEVAEELARLLACDREDEQTVVQWPPKTSGLRRLLRRRGLLLGVLVLMMSAVAGLAAALTWPRADSSLTQKKEADRQEKGSEKAPAALASPKEMADKKKASRDQVVAWLRDHNRWGPNADMVRGNAADLDSSREKYDGFEMYLGPGLLKTKQWTLAVGRLGEFFVFPLTAEDVRPLHMPDNLLRVVGYRKCDHRYRSKQRLVISELKLDQGRFPRGERITGRLTCRLPEPISEKLHVLVTYYPARGRLRTRGRYFLRAPLPAGATEITFDLPGPNPTNTRTDALLVYFVAVASYQDQEDIIESNTLAVLLRPVNGPPAAKPGVAREDR